jgi:FtsH-binding integral membrane protein
MVWQNPQQSGAVGSSMTDVEVAGRSALATQFLNQVFGWMAGGLATSGAVAYAVLSSQALYATVARHFLLFAILQLAAVMVFSGMLRRMSVAVAAATFLGYSALTGLTLGVIVSMYTTASVANAFFVSAGTFGAMAFIGATTKKNLSGLGSFLMMGVIAILIASVVNFFLHSGALDFAVSILGALIFTGLAAVDVQRFKSLGFLGFSTQREASQMALRGALNLYLDFINMFLFLLRIFGDRRR